ncbi:MAG: SDR family oxidoreductase [Pyrinomonadaceae bacterium]|nr:SDR family oxidoreductase [Pyrinomonadaceae bacterium]MCX7640224.1 SDR family oxidoreductase [Pyrinomonadaceae bacterium]MDW8303931.1 SDR family oxidoreductase [Acidobacteriota bacterium]
MKVTLITGASSGIGESFAKRLAKEKHNLVLVARSRERLERLAKELSSEENIVADYISVDLSEPNADLKVFEFTESRGFQVNWLINNAGFGSFGYFSELDLQRELQMIRLNVEALVALTHRYLQKMRQMREGVIINVSSAAGFQPVPFMATYAATKAFVTSFTAAIAEENRPHGIIIQALCPGATETKFFETAKMDRLVGIKGMQTPEQVVETALKAVRKKKVVPVSGFANYLVSVIGSITPEWLVTRAVASIVRPKLEKK